MELSEKRIIYNLAKQANVIYEKAVADGISDSDYYRTVKDELSKILKNNGTQLVNMKSLYATRKEKKLEHTALILSRYIKSPYNNLETVNMVNEKRLATFTASKKNGGLGFSRKRAQNFIEIMASDVWDRVSESLAYVSYNEIYSLAKNSDITVEDIEDSFNEYSDRLDKDLSDVEKADLFLSILKSKG